jgi:hypothetical protein
MIIATLALLLALAAPPDLFTTQFELQGLYDEISQASMQFMTSTDADEFQAALLTPDWTFTDASGQTHGWAEMRDQIMHAPPVVAATQPIQKLALVPGGATVTINEIRTRPFVDADGKYGKKDAQHMMTTTTSFRDTWVQVGEQWKFKSRQQLGPPKQKLDVSDYTD